MRERPKGPEGEERGGTEGETDSEGGGDAEEPQLFQWPTGPILQRASQSHQLSAQEETQVRAASQPSDLLAKIMDCYGFKPLLGDGLLFGST